MPSNLAGQTRNIKKDTKVTKKKKKTRYQRHWGPPFLARKDKGPSNRGAGNSFIGIQLCNNLLHWVAAYLC
jgi:hypothetical protein